MNKLAISALLAILLLCVLVSCSSDSDSKSLIITDMGWLVDSIDSDYFLSPPPNSRIYISFQIVYEGNIGKDDIETAKVTAPDGFYWVFDPDWLDLDVQNKVITYSLCYWGAHDGKDLPIGNYTASVDLVNGFSSSMEWAVNAPGSDSTDGKSYVCNEDSTNWASPPADYTRTIALPMINSAVKLVDSVTVSFGIDDSRAYNGYFWFFDVDGYYIGRSETFRDADTGNFRPGMSFENNGNPNNLTIADDEILYLTGHVFSEITRCVVAITDGMQYTSQGRYDNCDYRSISAAANF
jgi:hypothetical protein